VAPVNLDPPCKATLVAMVQQEPAPQRLPVEVEVEQAQAVKTANQSIHIAVATEATGLNGRWDLATITEAVVVEERIIAPLHILEELAA